MTIKYKKKYDKYITDTLQKCYDNKRKNSIKKNLHFLQICDTIIYIEITLYLAKEKNSTYAQFKAN